MATYQILYWHDIPIQVRAGRRRNRESQSLSTRFQEAIDNAAMAAGLVGTDAYLDGFTWSEPQEREGTPAEVVGRVVAELETQFSNIAWRQTAERLRNE
jgi:hypothetical protein